MYIQNGLFLLTCDNPKGTILHTIILNMADFFCFDDLSLYNFHISMIYPQRHAIKASGHAKTFAVHAYKENKTYVHNDMCFIYNQHYKCPQL